MRAWKKNALLIAGALMLGGEAQAAPVPSQQNRAGLTATNTSTFYNCPNLCINWQTIWYYNANQYLSFGFLNDTNAWTGPNSFAVSPTAPTASAGDNSTKLATTAFVQTALAGSGGVIIVGTTQLSGGSSGNVVYDNAGKVGELATTGSGSVVRGTGPTISGPVLAGTITGTPTYSGTLTFNTASTIASGTSATLDDLAVKAATTTVTGTTAITTSKGFNKISIYQPTITDASSAIISSAATLYLDNAPLAAGSATITQAWTLRTGAGDILHQTSNEATTFTDGTGVSRNAAIVIQRIVTGLSATPIGAFIDMQDNNATNQSAIASFDMATVPTGNSATIANLQGRVTEAADYGSGNIGQILGENVIAQNLGTNTMLTALYGVVITVSGQSQAGSSAQTDPLVDGLLLKTPIGALSTNTTTWTNINGLEVQDQNPSGAGTNTLSNPPSGIHVDAQTATASGAGAYAIKTDGGVVLFQGANQTGTFTDGIGVSRNATVVDQRIVTSLAAAPIGH